MTFDLDALFGLTVAILGGLAVGIERQWSGKSAGPSARFAGLRTFTLLGLTAGLGGWLWTAGLEGPSTILLAGLSAMVVVAYLAASRRDVDGTTEVAAFVVMASGVLAGAGHTRVAAGIIAITVLLLFEKRQLHGLVSRLDRVELQAGARFAVMAAVILPILPSTEFGPLGGIHLQLLWALVLFFSGLSFVGYMAARIVGPSKGYAISGTLGGLLSSTSTTLTFARLSREEPGAGRALAAGTLGANVMLFPRVLVASALLAPALTRALWPAFVLPALIGTGLVWSGLRDEGTPEPIGREKNPLQFWAAMQMAVVFQLVLFGVAAADRYFGEAGLYGSATLLGLVDMDALTISMANLTADGDAAARAAALAVTIGVLSNTVVKLGIVLVVGRGRFRSLASAGLLLIGLALAAAVSWVAR